MKHPIRTMKLTILLATLVLTGVDSHAALQASDNASNAAYNSGFTDGTNGGSGFGAWTFNNSTVNPTFAGEFIGDSSLNGNGTSGNINIAGESWGLYSNTSNTANATRSFLAGGANGLNTLALSESFSLTMDNGFLNTGQSVGFGLQNSSGTNRIEFFFLGGNSFYDINVGGTVNSTNLTGNGTPFTADGLSIKFNQLAANGWTLEVTPNGGSLRTYSSANFGALGASDISQVRLFNFNNDVGGSSRDAFFNSLDVVPEPASTCLIAISVLGLSFARRRRA